MATKLLKKDLVSAYKELDKLAGIDPAIEYNEMSDKQFEKELWQTYLELVDPEQDEFTKKTQATFDALVEKYGEELPEEEEEEEVDEAEEEHVDDDDEEEEEEEEEEEPAPKKKPVKKGAAKKTKKPEPEPEEEEDDEEEEDEEEEEEKPKKAKKEKKAPKPKKEKKDKGPGRAENFAQIFNEGVPYTADEYVQKMVELYPRKINTDVPARVHFSAYSKLLIVLGYMKKTADGKYVKVG